jgi:hypothetical protein
MRAGTSAQDGEDRGDDREVTLSGDSGRYGWLDGRVVAWMHACTWHSIRTKTRMCCVAETESAFHAGLHVCKKHAGKKHVHQMASCRKSACTLKGCKQRHTVLMQGRCATQYDDTQPHAE